MPKGWMPNAATADPLVLAKQSSRKQTRWRPGSPARRTLIYGQKTPSRVNRNRWGRREWAREMDYNGTIRRERLRGRDDERIVGTDGTGRRVGSGALKREKGLS